MRGLRVSAEIADRIKQVEIDVMKEEEVWGFCSSTAPTEPKALSLFMKLTR
jgi:hypothetical protein